MDTTPRPRYTSDVSDEEWAFLAPYLTLMREDAPHRHHPLRELFNGLCYIARTGLQWRFMPIDLPPWQAVYQQTRRWIEADVFTAIIADLREVLRNTRLHVYAAGLVTIWVTGWDRLAALGREVADGIAGRIEILLPGLADMMRTMADERSVSAGTLGIVSIAIMTLGFYRAITLTIWHAWDRSTSITAFDSDSRPSTGPVGAMFLVTTFVPLAAALVVHRAMGASGFIFLLVWAVLFYTITLVGVVSAENSTPPPIGADGVGPATHSVS